MSPSDPERKQFTLLGETLPIRTHQDPELAEDAFHRVEKRLESLQERSGEPSSIQLALLVALNLAGDLIRMEQQLSDQHLSSETRERLDAIRQRLRQLLPEEQTS